ncbi:Arc family DNA-binding protein [Mesorhizobium sp. NZP2077]|nr:Arc family DNA-binding protein [Mesorhizobium sp. NZP2077]
MHDMKIRVSVDLKEWLVLRAERNGRSMTSELIQILKAVRQTGEGRPEERLNYRE